MTKTTAVIPFNGTGSPGPTEPCLGWCITPPITPCTKERKTPLSPAKPTTRTVMILGTLTAVVAGHVLPVQARLNGELGIRVQDPLLAALLAAAVSLTMMLVITLGTRSGRGALLHVLRDTRSGAIPWWNHLAGILGAGFVVVMSAASPIVGVAIYTVVVVFGQTLSGLMVDRFGLGPGGRRRITPARALGVVLAVAGVLVAVAPRLSGVKDPGSMIIPMIFIFLAGIIMSLQHGFNGKVAAHVNSPFPGTLLNYVIGGSLMLFIWLGKLAFGGQLVGLPTEPWLYLAGALGAGNLIVSAMLARRIGILLTGLGMIAGQLIGSLLLDVFLPSAGSHIYVQTVIGIGVVLCAMFLATIGPRNPKPDPARIEADVTVSGTDPGKNAVRESVMPGAGSAPAD